MGFERTGERERERHWKACVPLTGTSAEEVIFESCGCVGPVSSRKAHDRWALFASGPRDMSHVSTGRVQERPFFPARRFRRNGSWFSQETVRLKVGLLAVSACPPPRGVAVSTCRQQLSVVMVLHCYANALLSDESLSVLSERA